MNEVTDVTPTGSHDRLALDEDLRRSLINVYNGRLESVVESLRKMGRKYYFRSNELVGKRSETVGSMRSEGLEVGLHENIPEAAHLPVTETQIVPEGMLVEADRFAAEAVMQGAHLYAPGVKNCRGLKAGMRATVVDQNRIPVGTGIACQSETMILRNRQGIAIETLNSRFRLPSLRETVWYERGLIHLQSLPAMTTCRVLDPMPGEVIVDLNCSPAGKMSYLCQLSRNQARVIGFDRNMHKIDKAEEHLDRLRCKNYQLIAHDSRYAHLDYTIRADKVMVDPPCTGLGVMPKLSIDTTMADVRNLSAYQKQFIAAAAAMVKKGGTVVYSVCTITDQECERIVRFADEELDLVETASRPLIAESALDSKSLSQRFDPETDGAGYFIAKFTKR